MSISEPVQVALVLSTVGPAVLFALTRVFGGKKKDDVDSAAKVAQMWEALVDGLTTRVGNLESDVADLKTALADERAAGQGLKDKNDKLSGLLTDLMRWAILLRDEIIRMGGNVPPAPSAVESALTNLEP